MYTHQGPRLYVAADQQTVVQEGDPRAAFLLIAPGQTMSDAEAAAYGLVALEGAQGEKGTPPKPNKARVPRENKRA